MSNSIASIAENIQIFGMLVLSQLRAKLALVGNVARNYPGAADPTSHGSILNIPSLAIAGAARTRTANGGITVDDFSSGNVQVTMGQIYKAIKIDNLQRTFSNINLIEETSKRLAIILADGVDAQLVNLWPSIPYEVGTADGTAAFGSSSKLAVLAAARKVLSVNKVPMDRLQGVLGPTEAYNLRILDVYNQAFQWGDNTGRQTGELGMVQGFRLRESQSVVSTATLTTAAAWGTPLANGVNAVGATTFALKGLGTGTIKAGSIFQHAGNNYVVTADQAISANTATVSINPKVVTASVDGDTISISGVNGTIGAHSAAGSIGFAYDPDAFILVVRPQADFMPGSGVQSYQFSDPDSGLTFRLSFQTTLTGAGGTAMQEQMVADILVGTQLVRPEMAARINGQV